MNHLWDVDCVWIHPLTTLDASVIIHTRLYLVGTSRLHVPHVMVSDILKIGRRLLADLVLNINLCIYKDF